MPSPTKKQTCNIKGRSKKTRVVETNHLHLVQTYLGRGVCLLIVYYDILFYHLPLNHLQSYKRSTSRIENPHAW